MTDPAIVRGNVRQAVAYFIEAENGDLVDIEFECCGETPEAALPWPCYDFSPDYQTRCNVCHELIHNPSEEN